MAQELCDTTMKTKAAGPELFRCTLPKGHISPRHPLVQASTGKTKEVVDLSYCSPGRWMVLTYCRGI